MKTKFDRDTLAWTRVPKLSRLLKLVGGENALRILAILSHGEIDVSDLCDEAEMMQPLVSLHLGKLRLGEIVERRIEGRRRFYRLAPLGRRIMAGFRVMLRED